MVWADSEFAVPTSSFNSPVPLIYDDPRTGDTVRVCFNKNWLPYIAGALMQLVLQTTWETTDPQVLGDQQGRAFDLIALFNAATVEACDAPNGAGYAGAGGGDDFLLRQNPTNPCELQTSVDGVNWCTWADLSKCLGNAPQPGGGSPQPQPGGGCQDYPGILLGNGRFVIPTNLSTGDTVRLIDPQGAVSDSLQWFCANGNVFFDGNCIPLIPPFVGTDPLPSEPHLSIIITDGTNFYPLGTTGLWTVPMGVTNGQFELICNTITPGSVAGNFQFSLEVCNNAPDRWEYTFDFVNNPRSDIITITTFVGASGPAGQYTLSTGYEATHFNYSGAGDTRAIKIVIAGAGHLTSAQVQFAATWGTIDSPYTDDSLQLYVDPGTVFLIEFPNPEHPTSPQGWTGEQDFTDIQLGMTVGELVGSGDPGGTAVLQKLILQGTGVNPFLS